MSGTPGSAIAPIFAQQSISEMERTRRTPEEVLCEATQGLVHSKTAGTSYVEALRMAAQESPVLFCEMLAFRCP